MNRLNLLVASGAPGISSASGSVRQTLLIDHISYANHATADSFNINTWMISSANIVDGLSWWQSWICVWVCNLCLFYHVVY